VGRELVIATVARKERYAASFDGSDGQRCARGAVRRLDHDLLGILQEGVEARSAEDPDLRTGGHEASSFFEVVGGLAAPSFFAVPFGSLFVSDDELDVVSLSEDCFAFCR
jgi:hypothetical protein